ncbi:MAG: ABC transporter permease [Thermoplasmatota archaeon]
MQLRPLLLAGPLAFLALFYALPLTHVLVAAGDPTAWAWVAGPFVTGRLVGAFQQALLSTALAMAAAVPLAWLHHAHRIPGGRVQMALHAAPFVMPVFVVVYGWQALLGSHGGSGAPTIEDSLGPLGMVVLCNAYYNYGLAARLLEAILARRSRRIEEAARTLGASPKAAFYRTTFAALAPAGAAVALVVFLFCFGSFGVVLLLGNVGHGTPVSTVETLLWGQLQGIDPHTSRAAALGIIQLVMNVALLAGVAWASRYRLPAERWTAPPASRPVAWASWALCLVAMAPLAAVLVGAWRVGNGWSFAAWHALLNERDPAHVGGFSLPHALGLSLWYAFWAVLLSLLLTACVAYGGRRLGPTGRRISEGLAALPLGTSSLLIGLALLLAYGAGGIVDLRGTRSQIILAHTLLAFPFTARVLLPAFAQRDVRLDDAAQSLGASTWQVARRIHLPTLRPALAAAAGFAAAMSLGDFGASLVLMRTDNASLAVWTAWHDLPYRPIDHAQATALAALLGVLAGAAYALFEWTRPKGVVL